MIDSEIWMSDSSQGGMHNNRDTFNRRRLLRRAAIELSLHWIFVIVIGAIILIFFITIVVKQNNIAEQNILSDLRDTFRSYVVGAQSSARGAVEVPTFGYPFRYICQDTAEKSCLCEFSVGGKNQQSFVVSPSVLFAPTNTKDSDAVPESVIVWSLPWRWPFPVTSFIYFIRPDTRFIFVYDDSSFTAQDIEALFNYEFSDKINKELVPFTTVHSLKDRGDAEHRVIFLGAFTKQRFAEELPTALNTELPAFLKNDRTVVVYSSIHDRNEIQEGKVFYYAYDEDAAVFLSSGESRFVGLPSAIGSFFVDDVTTYNCAVSNAFLDLRIAAQVQQKRAKILEDKGVCSALYTPRDQQMFERLIAFTDDPKQWNTLNYNDLINTVADIEHLNTQLEHNSCPLLY